VNVAGVGAGVGAAACWGAADFGGGFLSRRARPLATVVVSQLASLLVAVAIVAVIGEPLPGAVALGWASLAGASGFVALVSLYRALATRTMGPVSAVATLVGVALPVVIGLITGDRLRPTDLLGIACAVVAIALVTRPSGGIRIGRSGVGLAVLSGIGAGGFFVCMGQSAAAGGTTWWPLIAGRATSVLLALAMTVSLRQVRSTAGSASGAMALIGVIDMIGVVFFLFANAQGALGIAVVLSSQYPAVTMLLARVVLGQRLALVQVVGMAIALVGIGLIALP
jgi:drug/metabolite transporter (DMT)-like permease